MNKMVIAVSSRTLFDMNESHEIFTNKGLEEYAQHQISNEEQVLTPGPGFSLVKKLLNIQCKELPIEVILISKNSPDTGLRVFNSIEHYGLNITRAVFTSGAQTHKYANNFDAQLFLSSSHEEVEAALDSGMAAATIMESGNSSGDTQLRLAFDGDAVIFSDESERVYQEQGLEAFVENEKVNFDKPMNSGPFKDFLLGIQKIQSCFPMDNNPIRTCLITARMAPAHKRVIHTMRDMGLRIDEILFLGGLGKGVFLKSFEADIFFDDHKKNCEDASQYVSTAHVPNGVNGRS